MTIKICLKKDGPEMNKFNVVHQYNYDVIKDLESINKEYNKELSEEAPDQEKLLKLRMQRLYRGMEMGTGYFTNKFGIMPY